MQLNTYSHQGGALDFDHDNPGELVPEETFTHSHQSWFAIFWIL